MAADDQGVRPLSPEEEDLMTRALDEWRDAVNKANLTFATKRTYVDQARRFITWLAGEYELPEA